jgi:alanine-synthesizing transaminase
LICDTYLSVSTPIQLAARRLLAGSAVIREQILERVRDNHAALTRIVTGGSATVLPVEGGWSAVIRVPAIRSEEALVLELLEKDAVAVHPGYFFDFPHEAFLVVSLLPPAAAFARGVGLLQDRLNGA